MDVITVIPDESMRTSFVKSLEKVKLSEKNSQFLEQIKLEISEKKQTKILDFDEKSLIISPAIRNISGGTMSRRLSLHHSLI